jgi:predicted outer membrane protein
MDKYVELIKMLEKIFGKGSVSRTIGTRTNVVRFPKGKQPIDPTRGEFDVEGTAAKNPDLVQTIQNSIEDRMGDITKMNDQELLTYTSNVRRLVNFKEPPVQNADVIKFGSGQEIKGKGLEELIEKQGTKNPPTTAAGQLETTGKRLEQLGKDFAKEFDAETIAKQEADRQAMIARQYEGKGYAGGVFGPSGMYRAVARDFLLDQHAKGKIKLDADTLKNLEERNYISGGQPLMYADPIRVLRYHYGDDVFEKIPLDKIPTGARSEIIDVMSKVEAPPIKTEAPKTPGGYLTPGEYRANIEEMQKIEDAIKRRESRFADMTEEEIQNELAQYGGKRSSFEMGLEFDYPEEYAKYKGPKKPEPEEKADGGRIGMGLGGMLSGLVFKGPNGETFGPLFTVLDKLKIEALQNPQSTTAQPEIPLTLNQRYNKYLSAAGSGTGDELYKSYRSNLDKKADGGRIGYAKGKRVKSSIDKLIDQLNKKTQGKKSVESVNPKTGEVTVPKKPIKRAEEPTGVTVMDVEPEIVDERAIKKTKSRQLTQDEIADYEELMGRDSEQWMSEGTVEEAEKALKRSKAEEAYYYRQYKAGKLDPEPGENSQSRMRFLRKKAEEAEMTGDRRLITPDEMDELSDLESTYLKDVDEAYGIDTAIKKEMKKAMEEGVQKTNRMTELGLDPSSSKDYDKFLEMESIKQKYGNVIDDNLLQQILVDDNPQRKAEVLASIDEAIKMQEKGIPPEEIINIIKGTTRTKQAEGGIAGLI